MGSRPRPMRDVFFEGLFRRAKQDRDILLLSNDQGAPALDPFRRELPRQFINMAIAEQNMISVAAGLAHSGKNVFVYGIAPFVTSRCFEQIKIDLCVMALPVTIIGVGAGYSYAPDGPTHHATEDLSIMRSLSGMQIYSPCDWRMLDRLVDVALRCRGPLYLRLDREAIQLDTPLQEDRNLSGCTVLRQGRDVCLLATGILVPRALEVAGLLASRGIDAGVVDVYQLKPLAWELCLELARYPRVATLDEHSVSGGLGTAIAEILADLTLPLLLRRFAPDDGELYVHAPRAQLHWEIGLDAPALTDRVATWCKGQDKTLLEQIREDLARRDARRQAEEAALVRGSDPALLPPDLEPLGLSC